MNEYGYICDVCEDVSNLSETELDNRTRDWAFLLFMFLVLLPIFILIIGIIIFLVINIMEIAGALS